MDDTRHDRDIRVRVPQRLLDEIDRARNAGLFRRTRSQWIRDAIERYTLDAASAMTTSPRGYGRD